MPAELIQIHKALIDITGKPLERINFYTHERDFIDPEGNIYHSNHSPRIYPINTKDFFEFSNPTIPHSPSKTPGVLLYGLRPYGQKINHEYIIVAGAISQVWYSDISKSGELETEIKMFALSDEGQTYSYLLTQKFDQENRLALEPIPVSQTFWEKIISIPPRGWEVYF